MIEPFELTEESKKKLWDFLFVPEELDNLPVEDREFLHKALIAQLRRIEISLRSDWHAGMEAILKLDARKAENGTAVVDVEERLGEEPPRIDFIVWLQDEGTRLNKEVYRIFRRFNIIEYKNPHDMLNWRVIHKAIGYASLYVGLAEKEGDRPKEQVTVSIFRAVKNPGLFKELEASGNLIADETKGIYHVVGLTEFPFQIVIMAELVGDEYAAERALIDGERANVEDIKKLVEEYKQETDETVRAHMRVVLDLIYGKNPKQFDEAKRRYEEMTPNLLNAVRPEIDQERKRDAFEYVQAGGMTIDFAASRFHQSVAEFETEMRAQGFRVPGQAVAVTQ